MRLHAIGSLGDSDEWPSRAEVEAFARVRVPPGARDVRARVDRVLTKRVTFLRFSLPAAEVDAFLRESPFGPLAPGAVPELLETEPRPDWFAPERSRSFAAAAAPRAAVLVDTGDAALSTVYVVARS